MPDSLSHSQVSRRQVLAGLGVAGFAMSPGASHVWADSVANRIDGAQGVSDVLRCSHVAAIRTRTSVREGSWNHVNTTLSNEAIRALQRQGTTLSDQFIALLTSHHGLAD